MQKFEQLDAEKEKAPIARKDSNVAARIARAVAGDTESVTVKPFEEKVTKLLRSASLV